MENLIKMDDLGVPLFSEIPIFECVFFWNDDKESRNIFYKIDVDNSLDMKLVFACVMLYLYFAAKLYNMATAFSRCCIDHDE